MNLEKIISESIKKVLSEEHRNEVYELDTAIQLINKQWTSPDDFWYIFITQRRKDNINDFHKNHNGDASKTHAENYVAYGIASGNTKEEAIESLKFIKMNINPSFQRLISSKGNVITSIDSPRELSAVMYLCNKFNARCYMKVNKRSSTQTGNYVNSLKQRGMERNREFQFAAGRAMTRDDANVKWTQIRPWGLIDCDIDDENAQKELEVYLAQNGITPEMKYKSHDGMHYLMSTNDAEKVKFDLFDKKYRPQNTYRRQSDPMVLYKHDACILLYSAMY